MRKKIVAGNWKMNLSLAEGTALVQEIQEKLPPLANHQHVIFCAPHTHLDRLANLIENTNQVHLGAQNCNDHINGAYTGEISIDMLRECGVDTVIIGHSERRQYYHEHHELLKNKVNLLVQEGMHVLFCCGEPLSVRESNTQNDFVRVQLEESLFQLDATSLRQHITIAYEPIWAIGTGVTATVAQAQEMHAYIRSLLSSTYDQTLAESVSILYGGSCNPANAAELFACDDVDGGLIGGAALKAETFLPIIAAMP
jgi:triosephosphate isomerase (TIM)